VKLEVVRHTFTELSTIGDLFIDGDRICNTLEDKDRLLETAGEKAKVYGNTAIPRGEYKLVISWSNRFSKYMMELLKVPYYTGVRIHAGNIAADTDGCILLGNAQDEYRIINSRIMVNRVFDIVEAEIKKGREVSIVVR